MVVIPKCNQRCGIYILICIENQRFYIGSSIDLKRRLLSHRTSLRKSAHENPHLQNAWDKYGEMAFIFGVLEYCLPKNAVIREQYYIDRFRAAQKGIGFNISPTAGSCLGLKASPKAIAALTAAKRRDRSKRIIQHIDLVGKEFEIVSPSGKIIKGRGLNEFARQHGLNQATLCRVLQGKQPHTMGWHLSGTILPPPRKIRDPQGIVHEIPVGEVTEFARQRGLKKSGIHALAAGTMKSCRGWSKVEA